MTDMDLRAGFEYAELEFDKHAKVVDRGSFDELLVEVKGDDAPDIVVLSHGWNNHMADARKLYVGLAAQLRSVLTPAPPAGLPDGPLRLVGVLWPSKKFTDHALIPGGAAGAGPSAAADAALVASLEDLPHQLDDAVADARIEEAERLIGRLADSPKARDEFVDLIRSLVPPTGDEDHDDLPSEFRSAQGRDVLKALDAPVMTGTSPPGVTSPGGGVGMFGLGAGGGGPKAAAQRFLNLTTYYQMKSRAGLIGASGLNPCLRELRAANPEVRLHLVGHSFGGRLVTAATVGATGESPLQPDTVTLLQAAFSHYGFAEHYEGKKDGFFRRLVTERMVNGPVLITHSKQDTAVGQAYPLASRLASQVASALGDANDRYGGIGRNGAQKTPEARVGQLQAVGTPYDFSTNPLHNLNADNLITGHSDICKPEVAFAILTAVGRRPMSRSGKLCP